MNRRNWPVAPDALPIAGVLAVLGFALYRLLGAWGLLLPGILILFTLFFFRNPNRTGKAAAGELICPADGQVLSVREVEHDDYIGGPALKISIFLSLFNVHVNRSPIAARVEFVRYQEGRFLPAFKNHASEVNERNYVGLVSLEKEKKILLCQVTGFVARRVVCWAKAGDLLEQGERFGLMKFGSCIELTLPRDTEVYVETGMKVKGGTTLLGRLA